MWTHTHARAGTQMNPSLGSHPRDGALVLSADMWRLVFCAVPTRTVFALVATCKTFRAAVDDAFLRDRVLQESAEGYKMFVCSTLDGRWAERLAELHRDAEWYTHYRASLDACANDVDKLRFVAQEASPATISAILYTLCVATADFDEGFAEEASDPSACPRDTVSIAMLNRLARTQEESERRRFVHVMQEVEFHRIRSGAGSGDLRWALFFLFEARAMPLHAFECPTFDAVAMSFAFDFFEDREYIARDCIRAVRLQPADFLERSDSDFDHFVYALRLATLGARLDHHADWTGVKLRTSPAQDKTLDERLAIDARVPRPTFAELVAPYHVLM